MSVKAASIEWKTESKITYALASKNHYRKVKIAFLGLEPNVFFFSGDSVERLASVPPEGPTVVLVDLGKP